MCTWPQTTMFTSDNFYQGKAQTEEQRRHTIFSAVLHYATTTARAYVGGLQSKLWFGRCVSKSNNCNGNAIHFACTSVSSCHWVFANNMAPLSRSNSKSTCGP